MRIMRIVIDKDIPFIRGRFPEDVETVYATGADIDAEMVKEADALIVRTRTKCDENLLKGSKVKLVATATIGTDHIDTGWCEANGITVRNSPGCNAPGVAQYVFASLFGSGFDPSRDTLGIIGYGHVGRVVGDWARQMGINVKISDEPLKQQGNEDAEYHSQEEVLKDCDAITLHVPLTKSGPYPTYHLIGEKEMELMKAGSMLVNSSRGGVVDEKAMKKKLERGELKAIIDVWENEPRIDEELVILASISTPHIAGYSEEGKKRATQMVLETVEDILEVPTDRRGLECEPHTGADISRKQIEKSYNPEKDSERLRENPGGFENLRNNYQYRHEPLYI